jgi:hypothetical protein
MFSMCHINPVSQAINVVDNPLFRDWALYGRNNLTEHDLPHRTKLLEMIFEEYENEHRKTLSDFQVSHFRTTFECYFIFMSC